MKDKNIEIAKKRGSRLRACRNKLKLTQSQLAEKLNISPNYLSMLERGERLIDKDLALEFAENLSINPLFLTCDSDNYTLQYYPSAETNINDSFTTRDNLIIKFLILSGIKIEFICFTCFRDEKEYKTLQYDQMINVSFSSPNCKVKLKDEIIEMYIESVVINSVKVSFGLFRFLINRVYNQILNVADNIQEIKEDYEMISAYDLAAQYQKPISSTDKAFENMMKDLSNKGLLM